MKIKQYNKDSFHTFVNKKKISHSKTTMKKSLKMNEASTETFSHITYRNMIVSLEKNVCLHVFSLIFTSSHFYCLATSPSLSFRMGIFKVFIIIIIVIHNRQKNIILNEILHLSMMSFKRHSSCIIHSLPTSNKRRFFDTFF